MKSALAMPKTIRDVLAAYDRAAPFYDLMNRAYFFGRDKRFRSTLVERLALKPGDTVMNLCCGTGLDFPLLLEKIAVGGFLLGVDLSFQMLQQAKKKTGSKRLDLVSADAAYLPFRDEIFDSILLSFCLKITPAYAKVIEETSRTLKQNGAMGVLANDRPSGLLRIPGIALTRLLGVMAKINFEIAPRKHLSKRFAILEDERKYGGLVRFLLAEKLK